MPESRAYSPRNVLVVCNWRWVRSLFAEYYIKRYARKNDLDLNVESAGIHPFFSTRRLTEEMYQKADLVFVMEPEMEKFIFNNYGNGRVIRNLDVLNAYLPSPFKGAFSKYFFDRAVAKKPKEEVTEIKKRRPIRERWGLPRVFAYMDWEKLLAA